MNLTPQHLQSPGAIGCGSSDNMTIMVVNRLTTAADVNTSPPHLTPCPLTIIPVELLFEIASSLPLSTFNALCQASRYFHNALSDGLFPRALDPDIVADVMLNATRLSNLSIITYILCHGAYAPDYEQICDISDCSPLQYAAATGRRDIIEAFISHLPAAVGEAHAEYPWDSGASPARLAAYHGHLDIVKLLAEKFLKYESAEDSLLSQFGFNLVGPLEAALEMGHQPVVDYLLYQLAHKDFPHLVRGRGARAGSEDSNIGNGPVLNISGDKALLRVELAAMPRALLIRIAAELPTSSLNALCQTCQPINWALAHHLRSRTIEL